MSAADYAQAWGSADASAYNILLGPMSASPRSAGRSRALGSSSGLAVQSAQAHADEQNALSRQGLQRLSQIATLILLVAVLAMAAAIGSMAFGLYGQQLLDRALANVINFPVVYSVAAVSAILSLAIAAAAAILIIAIPGYLAAGVPPAVALQD